MLNSAINGRGAAITALGAGVAQGGGKVVVVVVGRGVPGGSF